MDRIYSIEDAKNEMARKVSYKCCPVKKAMGLR